MSYTYDKQTNSLVIDGWENGIASSPYKGIANIRNLNTSYYPGVAYTNYRRQACTLSGSGFFYAGTHSVDEGNNNNWIFTAQPASPIMTNPIQSCQSPTGLIYIQDDSGQIWKQSVVNSTTFGIIEGNTGRIGDGNAGIAYWNNYLVVFGDGLIEFCGDGTGDSGIIAANWNYGGTGVGKTSSTFTTNYLGTPATFQTPFPWYINSLLAFGVGSPITFTSTGTLPAPLAVGTTYYIERIPSQTIFYVSTVPSDPTLLVAYTAGTTAMSLNGVWSGVTGSYTITFSNGDIKTTTLTNGSAVFTVSAISSSVTTTVYVALNLTNDGTGTHTMTLVYKPVPLGNCTNVTVNSIGSAPYTTFYLVSYTDPLGNSMGSLWLGATGIYDIIMSDGQVIPAQFTNGSLAINLLSPTVYIASGSNWQIRLLSSTVTNFKPYVSKVDGSLYFCNGQFAGRLASSASPNITFNPLIPVSYTVSSGVFSIPEQFTDQVTNMVDLKSNLVVSGEKDVYTWDYVSPQTSSPSPVGEPIYQTINLLNNIYILAGQKGNIYISNGYSSQLLNKIPDYLAGVIDPVWSWGGIMVHRSKLFFQAMAKNTSSTNIFAGIFSLIVSPSQIGESSQGLVVEAQNSYGLTPASGALSNGVLVDNTPSASGNDSYYSAWSNGASLGGIDYNDTSLWQNWEPMTETDIIPIGTILDKQTMGNIEFKLDRPMASGDQIRMYWRPSLSDSYILMGTTTTTQLSDYYPSNISQSQWAQFKVEFKCASSGSSFIPLRQIRIHYN